MHLSFTHLHHLHACGRMWGPHDGREKKEEEIEVIKACWVPRDSKQVFINHLPGPGPSTLLYSSPLHCLALRSLHATCNLQGTPSPSILVGMEASCGSSSLLEAFSCFLVFW